MADDREVIFDGLLDEIDGLDHLIKEVAPPLGLLDQPRLLYLRFHAHEPQVDALAELLTDLLVDYAVPLKKRRDANVAGSNSRTGGNTVRHARLMREAKRLLIEFSEAHRGRYGELGELLSFAVAVHFLGAAQLGAKMALKTANGMPVHGVDGLHVKANDDGTVTFFLLESKIKPDATDATREMVESVAEYGADRAKKLNELRLVSDFSNLDALVGEQREAAKSYFNSYEGSGRHLKRRDVHVGSLLHSEVAYSDRLPIDQSQPIDIHEKNFEALYAAKHKRFKENLSRQASAKNLDLGLCLVFLIATPDVNQLKRIFAELNK